MTTKKDLRYQFRDQMPERVGDISEDERWLRFHRISDTSGRSQRYAHRCDQRDRAEVEHWLRGHLVRWPPPVNVRHLRAALDDALSRGIVAPLWRPYGAHWLRARCAAVGVTEVTGGLCEPGQRITRELDRQLRSWHAACLRQYPGAWLDLDAALAISMRHYLRTEYAIGPEHAPSTRRLSAWLTREGYEPVRRNYGLTYLNLYWRRDYKPPIAATGSGVMTPAERSASGRRGWQTRRANEQQKRHQEIIANGDQQAKNEAEATTGAGDTAGGEG